MDNETLAPETGENKEQTFEQRLARLGDIVRRLEGGDAPLADSLRLFEEGAALVAECTKQLDEAEQRVVKLRSAGGEVVAEPFGEEEQ